MKPTLQTRSVIALCAGDAQPSVDAPSQSLESGLWVNQLEVVRDGYPLCYNLTLKQGECLALQGKSGVGKSTLLHTLAGFEQATRGSVLWQGTDLLALAASDRPVSILFQEHNLFEHLSVWHNLSLGFGSQEIPEEAILQASVQLELEGQLHKQPTELSGGQRQRVALIRTLLRPEPLILLDEPFAELDPATRRRAADWTAQTARKLGKTLILVTHQREDADRIADRSITLTYSAVDMPSP